MSRKKEAKREDHTKSGAPTEGPKEERNKKGEGVPDGRSEEGHEEQSEKRAQEEENERHH